MDDEELLDILEEAETIAVVGCSRDEGKAAHRVPKYLQDRGYRVIPVNPFADEVLGEECYDSIADVAEEIDVIDIFRPSDEVYDIVQNALETDAGVIWMQDGIENSEARKLAEESGLKVVQDRCMMRDHRRLV